MGRFYSHLTRDDRLKIELMLRYGYKISEIAKEIQCNPSTIYREIKRATYVHRNSDWTEEIRYNPDEAERRYKEHLKHKGKGLKVEGEERLLQRIEQRIIDNKNSPYAALEAIKKSEERFQVTISLSTCYNYIRKGVFPSLRVKDCPMPKKSAKKKKVFVSKRASKGTSIEKRPQNINSREELGHWEMDTVVGGIGSKKSLLVLTERKTLFEVIEPLKRHTAKEVVKALSRIERQLGEKCFRDIFRSITVDNGTEFSDWRGIEASRRCVTNRTKVYVCHPYRSVERARNENQNRFIRRHLPKGKNFDGITRKEVKRIQDWMNAYPRKMFNGRSSKEEVERILQAEERERRWGA